jgi:hypothetical protein
MFRINANRGKAVKLQVTLASGIFTATIDGVEYSEAWLSNGVTTATKWINTHAATLSSLNIYVTKLAADSGTPSIITVYGFQSSVVADGGTVTDYTHPAVSLGIGENMVYRVGGTNGNLIPNTQILFYVPSPSTSSSDIIDFTFISPSEATRAFDALREMQVDAAMRATSRFENINFPCLAEIS